MPTLLIPAPATTELWRESRRARIVRGAEPGCLLLACCLHERKSTQLCLCRYG